MINEHLNGRGNTDIQISLGYTIIVHKYHRYKVPTYGRV